MDAGEVIALSSLLLGGIIIAAIIGGSWALGRQYERRQLLDENRNSADVAARLQRIELMLDTLSTDVERIAGDRYLPGPPR